MNGHFRKRGKSWYVWFELGPGPDGRRRQKSVGGFATKREAIAAFAELRDQHNRRNGGVPTSKLTLGQYLIEEWLPVAKTTLRPSTWATTCHYVRAHLCPALGHVALQGLTTAQLNAFYAELLAHGRRDGKGGLAPESVRHIHGIVHKALADAMRWGHLARNPATHARPPGRRRVEMKVWSPLELRTFLAHVAGDRLYAAWLLMATTGMRRGEVLGLRWVDVDLDGARLSVVQNLTVADHQVVVGEPKTAKGRRPVALDPATVAALGAHRRAQEAERAAAGTAWQDTGLVFALPDGSVIHPRRFSRWFEQRRQRAGLAPIRLHDIRHSYATAALAAKVAPKVVSERLGHTNVMATLDTYSHVLPTMQDEAAATVAALVLNRVGPSAERPPAPRMKG
ncbi:MAG TPA: tyrosine-type recombinase/integrase [Acidimicrobiales bacterium]|nr:tyrosine-type recombinase/integrase [Acidimicrobiales bacterium]